MPAISVFKRLRRRLRRRREGASILYRQGVVANDKDSPVWATRKQGGKLWLYARCAFCFRIMGLPGYHARFDGCLSPCVNCACGAHYFIKLEDWRRGSYTFGGNKW